MPSRRFFFILALLLFVPAIVMNFAAAFTPTYAHALAMIAFVFMLVGTMLLYVGFTRSS